MQKWEYKLVDLRTAGINEAVLAESEGANMADAVDAYLAALNRLGADGWQAVTIQILPAAGYSEEDSNAYLAGAWLMRPVTD